MSTSHSASCPVAAEPYDVGGEARLAAADRALVTLLTEEMIARWRRGDRPKVEEFLARHPDLCRDPATAAELIYEEFCLRRELGETVRSDDFLRRFPEWREQLAVLLDCAQILESAPDSARGSFRDPELTELLADYDVLAELGRGAVGRVYLATQPRLADRPVVLKVTPNDGREHLSLARLQHTHIVPLYSVEEDRTRRLRMLCMPYFGGTTLAHVLELLADRPAHARSGADVLAVLDQTQATAPITMKNRGPAWQFLARASYVQTICAMAACLADALEYAHARGLVHLDLKPSNVLITFDGQPMLLDFHLARERLRPGAEVRGWLGGTVGYMSPEQHRAVTALRDGDDTPAIVDHRSDIYSLGLILYQSLGGPVPLPGGIADTNPKRERGGESDVPSLTLRVGVEPPRLDALNSAVSTGLADIVAKCLAPEPNERYSDASSLAADLRRHLADLRLEGVTNRSLTERWRKWRRRRPHTLPLLLMIAAVLASAAAVGILARSNAVQRIDEARAALDEGTRELDERRYADAVATLKRGLAVIESLPRSHELATQINHQLQRGEREQLAADVHAVANRLRFYYAADLQPTDALRELESRCRILWSKRDWIVQHSASDSRSESSVRVRADLLDVAILWSDLHARLAAPAEFAAAHRESLRVLDEAESLGEPSAVLCLERQLHAESLGLADDALAAAAQAGERTARTAWEHFALGRFRLRAGNLDQAAKEFEHAIALEPENLWANFYAGVCAYRLGRHDDAVAAFTACVGAAPHRPEWFYNRALAYTALGRLDRAGRDYDHALRLNPDFAEAALNRGILYLRERRFAEAAADLDRALAAGANPAAVHYNLALVRLAQNDRDAALAELRISLKHDPANRDARELEDRVIQSR